MKLNELYKYGEGMYFIAYKESLWLYNEPDMQSEDDIEVYESMIETLDHYSIELEEHYDWHDIAIAVNDNDIDPSVVAGMIRDNSIVIDGTGNFRHSVASTTLLKVMDELNMRKVVVNSYVFGDDGEEHEVSYTHT